MRRGGGGRAVLRGPARAFTLIELLVVVAVIGILASLLMPAILRATRSASSANCKSNLRQVHIAHMNYAKQYSLYIVPTSTWYWSIRLEWYELLEPFVQETGIWKCPAKDNASIGYGQNYRCMCGVDSSLYHLMLWYNPVPMNRLVTPSGSIHFCDTGYVVNKDADPNKYVDDKRGVTGGYCRFPLDYMHGAKAYIYWDSDPWRPIPRHPSQKANCLFFDGHVEAYTIRDLVEEDWGEPNCLYDNQ